MSDYVVQNYQPQNYAPLEIQTTVSGGVGSTDVPQYVTNPPHCLMLIVLVWTSVPGATGYRLYRDNGIQPYYDGTGNSYNDIVEFGTLHSYEITSYNVNGESARSTLMQVSSMRDTLLSDQFLPTEDLFLSS